MSKVNTLKLASQVNVTEANKICTLVFNHFHVKAYRLITGGNDVNMVYDIYTDVKLSKDLCAKICIFCQGILATIKSY